MAEDENQLCVYTSPQKAHLCISPQVTLVMFTYSDWGLDAYLQRDEDFQGRKPK